MKFIIVIAFLLLILNQINCFNINVLKQSCDKAKLNIRREECIDMVRQVYFNKLVNNTNCEFIQCRNAIDLCRTPCFNNTAQCSLCLNVIFDNCYNCVLPPSKNEHCCQIDSQWGYCSICCNPGQGALCQTKNWPPCRCI